MNEDNRLLLAVRTAVQLIEGCDHAGITEVAREELACRAASDTVAERADRSQHELREGPCVESLASRQMVVGDDLANDERWPAWAPRAVTELGVACTASLWVRAEDGFEGSLNLYGDRPGAFDEAALAVAQALAERLGVAITVGRDADELNAVGSRTVIGQAQGILMERLGVDAEEALGHLRRAAEHSGLRLAQVAVDLVRTRQLPGAGDQ